jgi:hypothetical protein
VIITTFQKQEINKYVGSIRSLPDLSGKTVLDIPCDDSRANYELRKKADNVALEFFPHIIKLDNVSSKYANLSEILLGANESIDYIIC